MDLNDFYSTFFSADAKNIKTLDMQATFKATFIFQPGIKAEEQDEGFLSKIGNVLKKAGSNALANVTGGLLTMDSFSKDEKLEDLRKKSNVSKSMMEFLITGTKISDGNYSLDMTMFIQQMTLPNIQMSGIEDIQTLFGNFSTSGYIIEPDSHEFTMSIVNTKLPIHETIFYPWMQEVTSPFWCYSSQPYTTATVEIDLSEHADLKYKFYGCRPYRMITLDPTMQTPSQFTRDVIFKFDYMMVESQLKIQDNIMDKLKGVGTSLLNSAGGMIGL